MSPNMSFNPTVTAPVQNLSIAFLDYSGITYLVSASPLLSTVLATLPSLVPAVNYFISFMNWNLHQDQTPRTLKHFRVQLWASFFILSHNPPPSASDMLNLHSAMDKHTHVQHSLWLRSQALKSGCVCWPAVPPINGISQGQHLYVLCLCFYLWNVGGTFYWYLL